MKTFFAGTLFGIVLSTLAGAGVLYKMGKLSQVVERLTVAVTPNPPFPYPVAGDSDTLGNLAPIAKPLMPADSLWNRDVSADPVDSLSDQIIARIGKDLPLHPEFGGMYRGAPNGIPYTVVAGDQKKVPVEFDRYGEQSDPGPYPVPDNVPIEGGENATGDRHALIYDRDNQILYELFDLRRKPGGKFLAASGAIFDLKSGKSRPDGWTSADAAGLPVLPGLVRYDEAAVQKEIHHALRFTVPVSRRAHIPPALHNAGSEDGPDYPPMGMRVRLKADYDISGFPEEAQVILRALKKYGMIVADNGSPWFLSGAPHPKWNDANTHTLKKVKGSDFEVVSMVASTKPAPPKTEIAKLAEPSDPKPPVSQPIPPLPPPGSVVGKRVESSETAELGIGGAIHKSLTPPDSVWNKDVSKEPVDRLSDLIIGRIGRDTPLHPDFGAPYRGAPNGIPYVVVPGNQPKVPVHFDRYGGQSDQGPYPIPNDIPIEGGPKGTGDRHALMLDRDNWVLYELFDLRPKNGRYIAASGAIFDLKSNRTRPEGWTSADAAGLPILPGLVRYDEVIDKKEINHALRFTVPVSRMAYIPPATHFASSEKGIDYPPMGMRVRLKADYDISEFPLEAQVILKCLKKYGMINADNGGPWFISGAPDNRWNDIATHAIKKVKGRDLEVIQMNDVRFEAD